MPHDSQPWELEAILFGGQCGGEYLESINKTDLAQLTSDEWAEFVKIIALNYHEKHNRLKPCSF